MARREIIDPTIEDMFDVIDQAEPECRNIAIVSE
jgi:hypothetical protein